VVFIQEIYLVINYWSITTVTANFLKYITNSTQIDSEKNEHNYNNRKMHVIQYMSFVSVANM
jgi:hypothetical protein